ncbi:diguanylate cyclase [Synechocystis sp. PCC 7338]|uniref:diguanylate cyclase n=1 Tax=Synechocystis sp. PCC 7338 TaxID=2732530 RepID=UPI001BAFC1A6|nr:diguanylate cyclase [Synechocystis sp. PCC 7338]QUS60878.1 diguanylate cyclase [Synechocystis sp. PCC 7338]
MLKESEGRFFNLADHAPILIWMSGLDKGCFYFNRPWLDFTGRTLQQEEGNGWAEGVHPDDFQRCLDTYVQAFDARQPFTMEYRLRNAAGEYRWLLDNGIPHFTSDGKFLGYIGSCVDINDRHEARLRIEKSEWQYRNLVESINNTILRWKPTGEIIFINQYGQDFFGFTEAEIVGKSVMETIVSRISSSGENLETLVKDICDNPDKYEYNENENIKKNGDRVWVAWKNKPIFDAQGNLVEVLATGTDITDRKLSEDKLRQREIELTETQKLAKLGRWKFELPSGKIDWSEEMYEVFGWDPQSPVTYENATAVIVPGDRQRHQDVVDKVLETGETQGFTFRFFRCDGTEGWIWTRIEAVHHPNGEVVGLQGVAMDVSAQKRAEAELEKLNEELEQRVLERTQALAKSEERLCQVNEQLQQRLEELKRRNKEMEVLSTLSDYLQSCVVVPDACASVAALAPPFFPNTAGTIFLFDSAANYFEMVKSWGNVTCSQTVFNRLDCWALRRGQAHWVGEQQHDLFCNHLNSQCLPKESLCIPLIAQAETIGLFNLCSDQAGSINPEQQQLAKAIAEQISLAIANIKLRERLENESSRDPLTGLFNRRYLKQFLMQEISRARRHNHAIGVIMADIDHFKQFNDQLGHDAGDHVLKIIARILQSTIRGSDIACRYGGEEMIIVLPQTPMVDTFVKAEQLRTAIDGMQVEYKGKYLQSLTVSFGVACYPNQGKTMEAIIEAADLALYRAKAAGRNRVLMAN